MFSFRNYYNFTLGSDPEFFYKLNGKVIGSEKIGSFKGEYGKVIIDGVQGELNPLPNICRESHLCYIGTLINKANKEALKKGCELSFENTVEIDKEELASLSPDCQGFGCTPSKNVYGKNPVRVSDASKFYKRSAGGHIHLGISSHVKSEDYEKVIKLLDILVGNTCVLLDKDPNNKVRRENYGRAGEYRTPEHGIEYRTLSNFWLNSYTLGHFVLGMSRYAVNAFLNGNYEVIASMVDEKDIVNAINNNDFNLALSNFKKLLPLFLSTPNNGAYPINVNSIVPFIYLVENGYENVFNCGVKSWDEVVNDWGSRVGFEGWANNLVIELKANKTKLYNDLAKSLL